MNLREDRKYYVDSKGNVRRQKKRLLALYNQKVAFAYAYCKLKQCYLTSENMREKQCLMKGKAGDYCRHLYILEGREKIEGVKRARQKWYKQ